MLLTTFIPLFQQLSGVNTCILYSSQVDNLPLSTQARALLADFQTMNAKSFKCVSIAFYKDIIERLFLQLRYCLLLIHITLSVPAMVYYSLDLLPSPDDGAENDTQS